MFEWEGRILDNKSIMMVKAALPYLDIPVGDIVDLEGLLRTVKKFCRIREQKVIDMILNFFMMKRMMSMMNLMNQASQMGTDGSSGLGLEGMLEMLKSQMPREQQDMFDMVFMMMSAMAAESSAENVEEEHQDGESGRDFQSYASNESPDFTGAGREGEGQGYEKSRSADYGNHAEAESKQPFFFPGGGFDSYGHYD